jgi:hypothetical protein
MTNHPNQPCFLADEGVGLDTNIAIHSPHYLSMQTQCQEKSRAKDSASSWFKPRYGSRISRGKVCIKVYNVKFQETGTKTNGAVSPACLAIALATADPTAASGYVFSPLLRKKCLIAIKGNKKKTTFNDLIKVME